MQETKVKQRKTNNKGITLVALVITVIVLLILAGVGLGAIAGKDGLIAKAREAAELYEQASRKEANAINEIFNMVNGGNQGESEEPEQPSIDAEGNVNFIYTPSTPTNGNVTVEISTKTGYQIQYREGTNENYQRYTGAFTVEENTAIYVKLANSSGVTGGVATGNVANIDKIAPNPFTPTIGEITENSIEVNANTIDTGSPGCAAVNTGIKEYKYYANGELKHTGLEENVTIGGLTAGTEYSIYVIAKDKAGNTTTSSVVTEETTTPKPITSTEIANNPEEYYGAYVDYTPQNGAPVGWRIFYADSENIYLIADDYVENKYAPNAKDGTAPNKEGDYIIYFNNIVDSEIYTGTIDIQQEDVRVKKWISHINNYISTYANMKAVAYLLDTSIWNEFKDKNNMSEYVIGGPTLEMFIASYNDINQEKTIQYELTSNNGYSIKWITDKQYTDSVSELNDPKELYTIFDPTKAAGYWLASPVDFGGEEDFLFEGYTGGMLGVNCITYDGESWQIAEEGLRPIICLKSEVQLIEQNGKYIIQ